MTTIITTSAQLATSTTAGFSLGPSVTALAGGGYVVTWVASTSRNDPQLGTVYNQNIYGRIIGADGVARPVFRIDASDADTRHSSYASVTALADGGFVVAWNEEDLRYAGATPDNNSVTQYELYRVYDANGAPGQISGGGPIFDISDSSRVSSGAPTVVAAADGGFDIISESPSSDDTNLRHYGSPGGQFATFSTPDLYGYNGQSPTDMALLASGGHVVVWSANDAGGDGDRSGVMMAVTDANGAVITHAQVNISNLGYQFNPAVVALKGGGFVVSWLDLNTNAIVMQRFEDDGDRVGAETPALTGSGMYVPAMAALSDGGFVITTSVNTEIIAQRFSANGTAVGLPITIDTVDITPVTTSVAALDDGGFVVSWYEGGLQNPQIQSRVFHAPETAGVTSAALEVVQGTDRNDLVTAAPGSFTAGDQVDLGAGTADKLVLSAAGTLDLTAPDIFRNVEVLVGTSGDDTFIVSQDRLAGVTSVSLGAGVNTFAAVGDFTLKAGWNVANIRAASEGAFDYTGNEFAQTITGNTGNNVLHGGGGNDTLTGGGGRDTLFGDAGDDTFYVETNSDSVRESVGGGVDTVLAATTFYLLSTSEVEFLKTQNAAGTAAIELRGNGFAQWITGNAGANKIDGGGGGDTLNGGAGADTMTGGDGNTVYYVDNVGDQVVEDAAGGVDLVNSTISYVLGANLEKLTLIGTAKIDATGNTLDNVLTGNANANVLDGAFGADTMTGGAGNDIYYVDDAGDKVVEGANGGADIVHTTLATYTLGANIEWLYMDGTGANIARGNDLANRVYGNSGDDRFVVDSGGADTFYGGNGIDSFDARSSTTGIILHLENQANNAGAIAGDTFGSVERFSGSSTAADSMTANAGRAYFVGGGGNDTLIGGANNDQLIGGDGNDSLVGGGARDVLWGGAGNDTMSGGTTADRDYFQFGEANFGQDRITDFQDGVDVLKFLSSVANDVSDFTINGNGTHDVVLTLTGTSNSVTLHNDAANITITAKDFLFY